MLNIKQNKEKRNLEPAPIDLNKGIYTIITSTATIFNFDTEFNHWIRGLLSNFNQYIYSCNIDVRL